MYYVYVLESVRNPDELYVGSTIDLKSRFKEHNLGKVLSTKRYSPWKLIYYEAYLTEKMARSREQKLKHYGNGMRELKKRIGKDKHKSGAGFTLIELLVVIAIIALLSSVALIAFMTARAKARDTRRLADITQMNTALELYFANFKGYPSGTGTGLPSGISPSYASSLPVTPTPADGGCDQISYNTLNGSIPAGYTGAVYYYFPSGTSYLGSDGATTVYPDYNYYFCLGNTTGNFSAGTHVLNPKGVR